MTISKTYVPNEGPKSAEIVFVGEAPGRDEERLLKPFIGVSGDKLTEVITRNGVYREEVYLANLSHYRPEKNDFRYLIDTPQLSDGIKELHEHLLKNTPKIIIPLGTYPLHYLTGKGKRKKENGVDKITGIFAYRSSILPCVLPGLENVKVVSTFHPSYILRDRGMFPIFNFDINKAFNERNINGFNYPKRNIIIARELELAEWTDRLGQAEFLTVDIETVKGTSHILSISFSPDPYTSIVIPNDSPIDFMLAVTKILNNKVEKGFHFGSFDTEQLRLNGFNVNNYVFDSLTAQHVLNPEFPRSLAFITTIYTREPYYKNEGKDSIPGDTKSWSKKSNKDKLYVYNGKDTGVDFECIMQQRVEIKENKRHQKIFNFEMKEIPMARRMSANGMLIDQSRLFDLGIAVKKRWAKLQILMDALVNKSEYTNVGSGPTMIKLLYTTLGLPIRKKKGRPTAEEDALVSLIAFCQEKIDSVTKGGKAHGEWKFKQLILKTIIEIRGLRKMYSTYIKIRISPDGYLRATWKVSGPETGRWACEKYVDGTGINQQTFPRGSIVVEE